jgi:HTH-type transcriptional regulator, sugar sensing transcriptional regulator
MGSIDLTVFGYTPTESLAYETLLRHGPGTGYAIARAAGLARANAYSSLESLVAKGAARVDAGRPRRYRPEPPAGLIARISNGHGLALERLSKELESVSVADTPTVVEIESGRAVLQLISHDVTRASRSVELLAPPDAYPLLAPALRRPASAGVPLSLWSPHRVNLEFAEVGVLSGERRWPGMPIIMIVDDRNAIVGSRTGTEVRGLWSSSPPLVAVARLALERFTGQP